MVRLTADYIVKCNGHTKRQRDESTNRYLKRITHLYMAERNIEGIDNLSACRNLTVLYLYDNKLNRTLNLGTAQTLTHLYLQNNNVSKIEGIGHLYRLTKLYIGYNSISVVEGLQGLSQLRELHVEHQRIPAGEKLLFEPRTLVGLSKCLNVLNVSGNHMDTLNELSILSELVHLIASENYLYDFEDLTQALDSWRNLQKLELSGNPICHKAKYRDNIIVKCQSLELLDGKRINNLEKKFLLSWKASKEARRRMKLESRMMGDLPPIQPHSQPPAPPPHYSIGGLPGGRKRFEMILAKSRSLPASAIPVQESKRVQQYSSPAARMPQNNVPPPPTLGHKSISDVTNLKSERQMTPHPNATHKARSKHNNANGVLKETDFIPQDRATFAEIPPNLNGSQNGSLMGQKRGFLNSKTNQRFTQRTGFSGHSTRFLRQTDGRSDSDIQGEPALFSAQGIQSLTLGMNGHKDDHAMPVEGPSKFGKPAFLQGRRGNQINNQGEITGLLAPMSSPRMEGGEGGPVKPHINGTSPRPIAVSP
ncbi:uncharacterized protein LOC120334240 [Styela clava]